MVKIKLFRVSGFKTCAPVVPGSQAEGDLNFMRIWSRCEGSCVPCYCRLFGRVWKSHKNCESCPNNTILPRGGWVGRTSTHCSLSVESVTPDRLAGHRAWHSGSTVGPKARLGKATVLGGLDPTCQNSGGLAGISIRNWTPPEPAPWICRSATFTFQLPAFSCAIYFPTCHIFTLSDQPSSSWPPQTDSHGFCLCKAFGKLYIGVHFVIVFCLFLPSRATGEIHFWELGKNNACCLWTANLRTQCRWKTKKTPPLTTNNALMQKQSFGFTLHAVTQFFFVFCFSSSHRSAWKDEGVRGGCGGGQWIWILSDQNQASSYHKSEMNQLSANLIFPGTASRTPLHGPEKGFASFFSALKCRLYQPVLLFSGPTERMTNILFHATWL